MNLLKTDLERAEQKGILNEGQAAALWSFLEEAHGDEAQFSFAHAAYYFGAFLILGAMGWFMTLGWAILGGTGIALLSGVYGLLFMLAGMHLRSTAHGGIPGALLVTCAVWMAPLIGYGVMEACGFWGGYTTSSYRSYYQFIDPRWVVLEVMTIGAALIAFTRVRHPFVLFPAGFAGWFMSMDLVRVLGIGSSEGACAIGFAMLAIAYAVDLRSTVDYAFWIHVFGMTSFWGGLSTMGSGDEFGKLIYALINGFLIVTGVFLHRRVFAVYGSFGVFYYLGHLSWTIFKDSFFFPIALTGLGIVFIAVGVRIDQLTRVLEGHLSALPAWLRALRPAAR